MAALGPWPARPSLAVAVSGGRDSLALTLLLRQWTAERGGRLLALTVDHRLRAGAGDEARRLGERLSERGIEHRVLTWQDGGSLPPGRPVQAAARAARYALLTDACRRAGLVHLCLAHQADDQAETLLLRLAGDSGPLGLAGMSACVPLDEVLLLRPLLHVPRARLAAGLEAAGESWLDDPANEDPRHRRVALRRCGPALAAAGLDPGRLAEAAALFGRLRVQLEDLAARLLAAAASWHPAGFLRLSRSRFFAAARPVARLALAEAVRALAGRDYPPPAAALDRTLDAFAGTRARSLTLAGLRLLFRGDRVFVFPEPERAAERALRPGQTARWGPLHEVCLGRQAESGLALRALGPAGWQAVAEGGRPAAARAGALPGPLLAALPALFDADGPRAVPALAWSRPGSPPVALRLRFRPERILGSFGFTVACWERHII